MGEIRFRSRQLSNRVRASSDPRDLSTWILRGPKKLTRWLCRCACPRGSGGPRTSSRSPISRRRFTVGTKLLNMGSNVGFCILFILILLPLIQATADELCKSCESTKGHCEKNSTGTGTFVCLCNGTEHAVNCNSPGEGYMLVSASAPAGTVNCNSPGEGYMLVSASAPARTTIQTIFLGFAIAIFMFL